MTSSRTYIRSFQTMLFNIFNQDSRSYSTNDFKNTIKKEEHKKTVDLDFLEEKKVIINFFE